MNETPHNDPHAPTPEPPTGETLYERLHRKMQEQQQLPPQAPVASEASTPFLADTGGFTLDDDLPRPPSPSPPPGQPPFPWERHSSTPPPVSDWQSGLTPPTATPSATSSTPPTATPIVTSSTPMPQPVAEPLPWERREGAQVAPPPPLPPDSDGNVPLTANPSDASQHRATFWRYLKSREFWVTAFALASISGLVLSVFFFWVLPMLTLKGEGRSVPRVVNLQLDEAVRQLEEAGLSYRIDSQYDGNVPPFTVLQQDPRNMTRVKPGRTIALLVAKHRPPTVLLPRIVNVDVQQATYLLSSWGLRVGNLTYVSGNEPDIVKKAHFEGQLLEENAALLVGSRVDLTISRGQGKGKVRLPDVRGRMMMDAISILKQHGLDVQQPVRYTTRGTAPDGQRATQGMVVLMDPAPGSVDSVRAGTVVELQVFGTGPEEVNEGTGDVTRPN